MMPVIDEKSSVNWNDHFTAKTPAKGYIKAQFLLFLFYFIYCTNIFDQFMNCDHWHSISNDSFFCFAQWDEWIFFNFIFL